jgi:phage terminase large subunit-like protein
MTMPMPMRAEDGSEAWRIANLSDAERARWFRKVTRKGVLADLEHCWEFWRRPSQAPPEGDWRIWLLMAGRGFGKTRSGAEWVRAIAETDGSARIALVGASIDETRRIMVEGTSGVLSIGDPALRPVFEPSLKRVRWPSGAVATLYSAAEPDGLRGPEHSHAWADEIGKWPHGEAAWDMLAMTMRQGARPRMAATTTPRGAPLIRRLVAEAGVAVQHGRMAENAAHLARPFRRAMEAVYGGTRLGRQELDGELFDDPEGALWNRTLIERCRCSSAPDPVRTVIGVDPPAGIDGDACGIVVVAGCADGLAWVLADESVSGRSPEGWARAVAEASAHWRADRVIAERNNGGAMVESVLRAADAGLPVRLVHAARGKSARAEPVAALYESGRAFHCGAFPALEDELCGLLSGGRYDGPGRSPDRADALVWAMTELMLDKPRPRPRVRLL